MTRRLLASCALVCLLAPSAKAQFSLSISTFGPRCGFGYRSSFSLGFGSYYGPAFCPPPLCYSPPPVYYAPPPPLFFAPPYYNTPPYYAPRFYDPFCYDPFFAPTLPPIFAKAPPPPLPDRFRDEDLLDAPIVKDPPPGFLVIRPRTEREPVRQAVAKVREPLDSAPLRLPKIQPVKFDASASELPLIPKAIERRSEYDILVDDGRDAFRAKQYGLARERYERALATKADEVSGADARIGLGHALTALGKYKLAADQFRRVADAPDPDALYAEGERDRIRVEVKELAKRLREDDSLAFLAKRLQ